MAKLLVWLREASLAPRDHAQLIIYNVSKGKELYKQAEDGWLQDNHIKFIYRKESIYIRGSTLPQRKIFFQSL
jgi:hypothetical protein